MFKTDREYDGACLNNLFCMKICLVLLLVTASMLDRLFLTQLPVDTHLNVIEASIDSHLVYIIITAAVLGVIKVKKVPGN